MKIIDVKTCRVTPWKNGGGSTTEIIVEPAGASLDDFDWRVSMASVAADGPFSCFPGIDRTLAVVSGSGLMLAIGDNAAITLDRGGDPVSFAGDVAASAKVTAGEIIDLNVMTRRSRFGHQLHRIGEPTFHNLNPAQIAVVLSFHGSTTVASGQDEATLGPGDAAILTGGSEASCRITPSRLSDCFLVLLHQQPGMS